MNVKNVDTLEYFQSMSDEPLKKCPECNGKVKRLISAGLGIIFKGSGFYVTDNKGKSKVIESNSTKETKKTDSKDDKSNTKKTGDNKNNSAGKTKEPVKI